jgi:GINS complex subunit 2
MNLIVYRAAEDFQESDKIQSLLKDIREARQAKSREGLSKIDHSELSVSSILLV